MSYHVAGTTDCYTHPRQAVEAFFGTSAVIPLGECMWMCIKTGATCIAVRE